MEALVLSPSVLIKNFTISACCMWLEKKRGEKENSLQNATWGNFTPGNGKGTQVQITHG